jgi:hypothetical protein
MSDFYNAGLPAVSSGNPLSKASGLSGLLDFLRPLATSTAAKAGARGLFGPLGAALSTFGSVMTPKSMGAEPPLYVRDAQGNMVPNTANPIVAAKMGGVSPQTSNAPFPTPVPLPQADPRMANAGSGIPLPMPRPNIPASASPSTFNPFYSGPGAQNYGTENMTSGNQVGGQGPGLAALLKLLAS